MKCQMDDVTKTQRPEALRPGTWQSRLNRSQNPISRPTYTFPRHVPVVNNQFSKAIYRRNAGGGGFTLLEILIALAIIGVLSAIAIPAYNGYIEKMKINTTISDINFIQVCIERYHTETFRYPPTIAGVAPCLPNNGIDPWGNAYVYLNIIEGDKGVKGQVRKDKKENPINTLYDLYSMGKDGLSKTQLDNKESVDDVVLAHDGAFIGLSSDY